MLAQPTLKLMDESLLDNSLHELNLNPSRIDYFDQSQLNNYIAVNKINDQTIQPNFEEASKEILSASVDLIFQYLEMFFSSPIFAIGIIFWTFLHYLQRVI